MRAGKVAINQSPRDEMRLCKNHHPLDISMILYFQKKNSLLSIAFA